MTINCKKVVLSLSEWEKKFPSTKKSDKLAFEISIDLGTNFTKKCTQVFFMLVGVRIEKQVSGVRKKKETLTFNISIGSKHGNSIVFKNTCFRHSK